MDHLLQQPEVLRALEDCQPAKDAMLEVDRAMFCDRSFYEDSPQPISDEATISAPHMHAYALRIIYNKVTLNGTHQPPKGMRILDVGSGSGYLTAALAVMFKDAHRPIVGIDKDPELVDRAAKNIHHLTSSKCIEQDQILFMHGDGHKGCSVHAPFHIIHIGADCGESFPQALVNQLAPGGVIFGPVNGQILVGQKSLDNKYSEEAVGLSVRYVPLVRMA